MDIIKYWIYFLEELGFLIWALWVKFREFQTLYVEKEMATHSSVLAWIIPGTGEPGGLPSMGSPRVGHD